jgi:hypothetical protein
MTAIQAVALYAGLNILLILFLSVNVSRHRRRAQVSLGTGTDARLEQACRAQGNTVEYVPVSLFALLLMATAGFPALVLHILGVALTLGRFVYAYGLLTSPGPSMGRIAGTALTWLVLLGSALLLIEAALT